MWSLAKTATDWGIGSMPKQELPLLPKVSTPEDRDIEYRIHRDRIMNNLKLDIEKNLGSGKSDNFCNDPRTLITLTVLEVNHPHLYKRQYRIAEALIPYVTAGLMDWLARGKIKEAPANCKFNSPLVIAPKYDKDGNIKGVRICIDSRLLNMYLEENDQFEIPYIPDILQKFSGAKIFGEFDLTEAYYQFKLTEESQKYTAFTWQGKQYVMVGCPFGIKHIPSFFQRYMNTLFSDMPFVFPYLDNITFASKTWDEHEKHAKMIIDRLNSVNLRLNPKDGINLGNSQIRLLGHLITDKGIAIDPAKREILMKWEQPPTGAGLASFLGLGTYVRDHIRHYAELSSRLEEEKARTHSKSSAMVNWTAELIHDFQLLKRAIAEAPFLAFPDFSKRFVVATDASQSGIGGIIYQPDDDNDTITPTNIIAICSKKLTPTQQRYPVYKKELYGMVYCLRKFHQYIWGRRNVIVYTDHKPLKHILSQQELSVSLQQWLDVILNYDLIIRYRPGILHITPDALSRMYETSYNINNKPTWGTLPNIKFQLTPTQSEPTQIPRTGLYNSDILCEQSLKDIMPKTRTPLRRQKDTTTTTPMQPVSMAFDSLAPIHSLFLSDCETSLNEAFELDIANDTAPLYSMYTGAMNANDYHQNTDDYYNQEEAAVMSVGEYYINRNDIARNIVRTVNKITEKLTNEEKLLIAMEKRGCTIPPKNQQASIVRREHDWGHYGEKAMFRKLIHNKIWWPNMKNDIREETKTCQACAQFTIQTSGYHPMHPINIAMPGDRYMIDLARVPRSKTGEEHILVLKDAFTGFIVLRPLANAQAETVAMELFSIFSLIGPPATLQSDHGPEFDNNIIKALSKMQGWKHYFSTRAHPQGNGVVERAIRTVKQTLDKYVNGAYAQWPLDLPFIQMQYNDKILETTGSTPFSLFFNREMFNYIDNTTNPPTKITMDNYKAYQDKLLTLVFPAIQAKIKDIKQSYANKINSQRKLLYEEALKPGSIVMMKDPKYLEKSASIRPSHEPKYIGTYTVVRRENDGGYILKDKLGIERKHAVSIENLKVLFHADNLPTREPEKSYEVEEIQGEYVDDENVKWYRVKWKDYQKTSWIRADKFDDAALIKKYEDKYIDRVHPRKTKTRAARNINRMMNKEQKVNMISNNKNKDNNDNDYYDYYDYEKNIHKLNRLELHCAMPDMQW